MHLDCLFPFIISNCVECVLYVAAAKSKSSPLYCESHAATYDSFGEQKREPPGVVLRYDGRLATPSACPHIVRVSSPSSVCAATMRYLSEAPATCVIRLWFDHDCQGQFTPRGCFRQNACPRRSFGRTTFCFLLSDEKLLGRFWVLIRIATAFRRLVATTL